MCNLETSEIIAELESSEPVVDDVWVMFMLGRFQVLYFFYKAFSELTLLNWDSDITENLNTEEIPKENFSGLPLPSSSDEMMDDETNNEDESEYE